MGDPRINILVCSALVLVALFVPLSLASMSVLLAYAIGLHAAASGMAACARHVLRVVPFAALVIAINALVVSGDPLLRLFGDVAVSRQGLGAGVFFAARLGVMVTAAAALVRLTPPERFARGLYALSRPLSPGLARKTAFYGFMAMSFVPLFADEFERIRVAQSFRGVGSTGGWWRRAASIRLVVVPLLLSAIHRSGQLAVVVEMRGLEDRLADLARLRAPSRGAVGFLVLSVLVLVAVAVRGSG